MTTTDTMLSTTEEPEDFTSADPCPEYCTLPAGHEVDGQHPGGRESRGHGDVYLGENVTCGSVEFFDQRGQYLPQVSVSVEDSITEPTELCQIAVDLLNAACWLSEQQALLRAKTSDLTGGGAA